MHILCWDDKMSRLSKSERYSFSGCLDKEKYAQPLGDAFIKQVYMTTGQRMDYNIHPTEQKSDIDILVRMSDKLVGISEKFRYNNHYDDILLEIFSDVQKNTLGWSIKSKADIMHYFRIGEIDDPCTVDIISMDLITNAARLIFRDLMERGDCNIDITDNIMRDPYPGADYRISCIPSRKGDHKWVGLVAAVKKEFLLDCNPEPGRIDTFKVKVKKSEDLWVPASLFKYDSIMKQIDTKQNPYHEYI